MKIRDKLVARHLFKSSVIAETLLERQMPAHVVRVPPGVLQALPEEARLPNPPNLMPPGDDTFLAVLTHQFAQGVHQFGLHIFEPLVVRAHSKRRCIGTASILLAFFDSINGSRTRWQGCRRYSRGVSIGRRDRARGARPSFSCVVAIHSFLSDAIQGYS
jgi:hypothetical protein